jgi:3'(2'), 5'-bisphosphate nucleotidase
VVGPDGTSLRYGKRTFLNRAFVATSGWKPPLLEPFLEPFAGGGDLPQGL